ncbi:DUF4185 domain-containing protein [Streptomyces sp. BA2]|uniref:DUF4185 domain-containing protein n=1 Tax=Streptomyces sp. BA2 TaxID=436595 RepID=UPI001328863B|nr:DUF4185 domain-containing protein [Streptomyces sp. BA2]MWA16073.1 DUF4185 domain-containing protein [Streptomyces sp. BA2]
MNKVRDLTGAAETSRFGARWTDLCIPALCPGNGAMFFAGGDTYDGDVPLAGEWNAPVGLLSSSTALNSLRVDSCVSHPGTQHVRALVPEGHIPVPPHGNRTTALPSDVFTIGDVMYMHLMRGPLYETHHTDFWRSGDKGETWQYVAQWSDDRNPLTRRQKTYAVADDGYCYVLSTAFDRAVVSDLFLHRVPQDMVGDPAAYQPWGFADGAWAWGNPPTTVARPRQWGDICLRAMGGQYVFTWLDMVPDGAPRPPVGVPEIRAQVLPLPTSNLFTTPEQQLITHVPAGQESGAHVTSPYGGFIIPGSTFDDFHIAVSQWYFDGAAKQHYYRVMQYGGALSSP